MDILRSCNLFIIIDSQRNPNHADIVVVTQDRNIEFHNKDPNKLNKLSARASIPVPIQYCHLHILCSDVSRKKTILNTLTSNHHGEEITVGNIINVIKNKKHTHYILFFF